jgi:hypothetical protein
MSNPDRQTFYFPGDDERVFVEQNFRGLYEAYREADVDDLGRVSVYGTGDTVLAAIADLNRELELVE